MAIKCHFMRDESAHSHASLSLCHSTKIPCAAWKGDLHAIQVNREDWFCTFVKASMSHISTGQCDKYKYLMCWQLRLWRVCTFGQACLSLRHSTEISRAGSNANLCTIYVSSEDFVESAPAATTSMCYHLCVVSMSQMLPVRCNKIPL